MEKSGKLGGGPAVVGVMEIRTKQESVRPRVSHALEASFRKCRNLIPRSQLGDLPTPHTIFPTDPQNCHITNSHFSFSSSFLKYKSKQNNLLFKVGKFIIKIINLSIEIYLISWIRVNKFIYLFIKFCFEDSALSLKLLIRRDTYIYIYASIRSGF